eukprot:1999601-Heterocapsa_arctica.AAC.1
MDSTWTSMSKNDPRAISAPSPPLELRSYFMLKYPTSSNRLRRGGEARDICRPSSQSSTCPSPLRSSAAKQ